MPPPQNQSSREVKQSSPTRPEALASARKQTSAKRSSDLRVDPARPPKSQQTSFPTTSSSARSGTDRFAKDSTLITANNESFHQDFPGIDFSQPISSWDSTTAADPFSCSYMQISPVSDRAFAIDMLASSPQPDFAQADHHSTANKSQWFEGLSARGEDNPTRTQSTDSSSYKIVDPMFDDPAFFTDNLLEQSAPNGLQDTIFKDMDLDENSSHLQEALQIPLTSEMI